MSHARLVLAGVSLLVAACGVSEQPLRTASGDPLPSWNEGPTKRAITTFVTSVTDPNGPSFVEPPERIAVFDNDGTLWAEQPLYFQLLFALDRVRAMAAEHPDWREQQPFKAILEDDREALSRMSEHDIVQVVMATHAGMTVDEFRSHVADWLATARHPRFDQPFTQMAYQPMLELLEYLRANEFKTFIVSGGGIDFMRVFANGVYGIPPEQVVGSVGVTRFELRGGEAVLVKEPDIEFIDDKEGKPVGINQFIGRRPIAAFGNSDGDLAMLQYTAGGDGPGLMVLVHHDDAEREWAYDRDSSIGRLDKALDEARDRDWTVISIKNDWLRIFPFAP
ncbi:MAG: HAD family hydrolase [Gemmatimonadales bacterium]|jgi:phosphoglycolate phosphatase-like HAD superfamily hydrolase